WWCTATATGRPVSHFPGGAPRMRLRSWSRRSVPPKRRPSGDPLRLEPENEATVAVGPRVRADPGHQLVELGRVRDRRDVPGHQDAPPGLVLVVVVVDLERRICCAGREYGERAVWGRSKQHGVIVVDEVDRQNLDPATAKECNPADGSGPEEAN